MKTLIDIDDDLLDRAAKELGTTTKKDTVNEALRFMAERAERTRALFDPTPASNYTEEENALMALGIPPGISEYVKPKPRYAS